MRITPHPMEANHERQKNLGYFDDIESAAAAVVAKRCELFTHNDIDRGV